MKSIAAIILIAALLPSPSAAADDAIVAEGIVGAPVAEVWRAFTTRAGMESWMVAAGDIELRVGGLMRTSYRKDADLNGDTAIHQQILSIDPERMLSYRTVKAPAGFAFAKAITETWTIIYFDPQSDGRTKVTVKMLGYTADPESQKMRAFFETGNKATMDGLIKKFGR
jgi:uncharacterized protein YndB with AHSA1/START domain